MEQQDLTFPVKKIVQVELLNLIYFVVFAAIATSFVPPRSAKLKLGNSAPTRKKHQIRLCNEIHWERCRSCTNVLRNHELATPPTKFSKYNNMLLGATKDVCDATMKDAVEEAVQENQNIRDIPVAVDETWQKRGYSSMNGPP
ncbi:hypothetical protein TNIN_344331 [Trichonephila inaurata madagascariensis]|uniref:Uncharacterized protein n=1 Tax=Trichonephila inaurata madagascariensis TaxID=2747483 RepID=A0A8X6YLW6_9ARAC|nr:hypothetical protein TNIN_344331 [Trichonephila inaurata madagascariensis]